MSGEQYAILLKNELGRKYMSQNLNVFMSDLKWWFSVWAVGHLVMSGDIFSCHDWGRGVLLASRV